MIKDSKYWFFITGLVVFGFGGLLLTLLGKYDLASIAWILFFYSEYNLDKILEVKTKL